MDKQPDAIQTLEITQKASASTQEVKSGFRKLNALVHGVYAEDIILPWEDPNEFFRLRKDIWEEFQIQGSAQEEAGLALVRLYWLKRRVMRAAQLPYYAGLSTAELGNMPESFDELRSGISKQADENALLAAGANKAIETLDEAAKSILDIKRAIHSAGGSQPSAKDAMDAADQAATAARKVRELFNTQVFPKISRIEQANRKQGAATVYEKAYSHEHLDKTLRLEGTIDARIAKQLALLVQLQEYKQLQSTRVKQIEQCMDQQNAK